MGDPLLTGGILGAFGYAGRTRDILSCAWWERLTSCIALFPQPEDWESQKYFKNARSTLIWYKTALYFYKFRFFSEPHSILDPGPTEEDVRQMQRRFAAEQESNTSIRSGLTDSNRVLSHAFTSPASMLVKRHKRYMQSKIGDVSLNVLIYVPSVTQKFLPSWNK
jgi:hypothetical protein